MIKLIKSTFFNEKKTKQSLTKFIKNADILSFSEQCQLFEKNFSKYQLRKDSIFVNSGSSANLAVIQALLNLGRLKRGDKVGFSAVTWSTNVAPLIQLGLKPVPIDIEIDTLNISSSKLSSVLRQHDLKCVFITNLLGFCDDIDEIAKLCKSLEIILVEDNCESLGTVYKGKKLGNYGLASTFSFYVGHHMSTIEGGMVCTNDSELSEMIRIVRAHGWDRNLAVENQSKLRISHKVNSSFYSRYTFYDLGYNLRPTEINGFLGNLQLEYIDQIVSSREKNFEYIISKIEKNVNYIKLRYDHLDINSNFAIPIICKSEEIRNSLVKKCKGLVEIRPLVGGDMTEQPFFKKYVRGTKSLKTINAAVAHKQGLYFGNNPDLTKKEIEVLVSLFE